MSRLLPELETVLRALADEHRRLLACVEAQQAAMKAFDLKAMDDARNQQEASRLRLSALETKRRTVVAHIARGLKLDGKVTLTQLADLHPQRREALRALGDEIKNLAQQIAARTHVAGRLSSAVLGHLNTVVRLLAGAVEKAGIYTKHGVPSVSGRIGVMEAVG
jgi:flagellar motility protein MotE (MotC chaperone)